MLANNEVGTIQVGRVHYLFRDIRDTLVSHSVRVGLLSLALHSLWLKSQG